MSDVSESVSAVPRYGRQIVEDVWTMLESGVDRVTDDNGIRVVKLFAALGVVLAALVTYDLMSTTVYTLGMLPVLGSIPVVGGISFVAVGYVVAGLAGAVLAVGAVRTFTTDETEGIPEEFLSRRLTWVLANLLVGVVVFTILVAAAIVFGIVFFEIFTVFLGETVVAVLTRIGQGVLVVSVTFLFVTFFFWWVVVVVEDRDFVESVGVSWRLTEGHRLQLLVLSVVLAAVVGAIAFLANAIALVGPRALGFAVGILLAVVFAAYYSATIARVYRDLRGDVAIPGVEREAT